MDKDTIHELARILGSKVKDRRGNVMIQCPMAPVTHAYGTDRDPAMSVKISPQQQSLCRCWACGVAGVFLTVLDDANEALQGTYDAALTFVQEHDKGGLAGAMARLRLNRQERDEPRPGAPFDVVHYIARCTGRVPQYLIDRGVIREDVRKWRIGYDEQSYRAVFPIWDYRGHLMGASRRTVLPKEHEPVKYHDTPGLPKDELFYGEHSIDPTREHVHIVEGILDAVFAARVLPNVVSIMGAHTGIKATRIRKLRKWCRRVTLILDADRAGDEAWAGRKDHKGKFHPGLRGVLRQHFPVSIARLPAGEDPASVPAATLLKAVHGAAYLGA